MTTNSLQGKKILFANFPADGHFNPMTGLAVYLQQIGCDVRWYTSQNYEQKLKKLQVPHYPFKIAKEIIDGDFDKTFPERTKLTSQLKKLRHDLVNVFILRGPEYYADIKNIYTKFQFDLLVADCAFTGAPFVKDLMNIPVASIGIMPLSETSKDLPPAGLGMEPINGFFGNIKQSFLRWATKTFVFGQANKVLHQTYDQHKLPHNKESVFDMLIKKSDIFLQSGTPGFEYERSDLGSNIRFIGSLLPHSNNEGTQQWFDQRLNKYSRVILVTQGTVEKDINKILIPTLEAFKDCDVLVVATTGGSGTQLLKEKYNYENIIIEDFIPFADVMPHADVYITNGGYGGVMLGIENRLPMVVAGTHEGKNEICARVGYFELGINLKTEKPKAEQIKTAATKIMEDGRYKQNVIKLGEEFDYYDPYKLSAKYIDALVKKSKSVVDTKLAAV